MNAFDENSRRYQLRTNADRYRAEAEFAKNKFWETKQKFRHYEQMNLEDFTQELVDQVRKEPIESLYS